MSNNSTIIQVRQELKASNDRIWSALTDLDELHQWYFSEIPQFKAEKGFETDFIIHNEGRSFHHLWKILEAVPNKKIVYSWKFSEYPGEGKVTFEIKDDGYHRMVSVTNEGLESFPQDIPEFKRESCEGGWTYFIKQRLKEYLDSSG